jgi:hypothetical protein
VEAGLGQEGREVGQRHVGQAHLVSDGPGHNVMILRISFAENRVKIDRRYCLVMCILFRCIKDHHIDFRESQHFLPELAECSRHNIDISGRFCESVSAVISAIRFSP